MRERLLKYIFFSSMAVAFLCLMVMMLLLFYSVPAVGIVELFTPFLVVAVLALVLSACLAARLSRAVTEPLDKIDISRADERDVEAELRPLIRRLNDQNHQIRCQMEALAREHEKQDRMRREFTANVSHELKTPLTSISGFAELMRDGLVKPEDVQPFAGRIYDEAQRLITLVGDIIRLSRLEEQDMERPEEPVSLLRIVRSVEQQLRVPAGKRRVTLEVTGDEGWITASPRIVEEVLYNLCDNAVKYNRFGGLVQITITKDEERVWTEVKDTGIGIPKEEQERIFERFYRVDKSHSKEVGGTGLGLSIVKHGAACLGAKIEVDSVLGTGTTVRVGFPISREPAAPKEEPLIK